MVHIFNVIKAFNTRRKLQGYQRAKNISEAIHYGNSVKISFLDRIYYYWVRYCKCGFVKEKFRANLDNKTCMWIAKQYYAFWTYGTFSNYIIKSVLGFVGGVLLTYLAFILLTIPMDFYVFNTWYISAIFMLILPVGLAFSLLIRCLILCLLPQLFTRQGRQAVLAYAFILLLTGPTRNIVYNCAIFADSLACTQEQLKSAARNITEIVMKPLRSLRNTMVEVLKSVKHVIVKIKDGLVYLKDRIMVVIKYIGKSMDWLLGSNNLCNVQLGSPEQRCVRSVIEINRECKNGFPPPIWFLCDFTAAISTFCFSLKPLNFFCDFLHFMDKNVIGTVKQKLVDFMRLVKTLFYVSISFNHSYSFETNQSRTLRQVAKDVIDEVQDRFSIFFFLFTQLSVILNTYLIFIVFRTITYWYAFITYDWFDNRYINQHLRDLDMIRSAASADNRTIFPLTPQEKLIYVSMWSFRLSQAEKKILFADLGFILKCTMHIIMHFFLDMSIYWVLTVISKHGKVTVDIGTNSLDVLSKQSGFLASFYKILMMVLAPYSFEVHFSTRHCLPHPFPPNFVRYTQITLLFVVWFMVIFEPIGLRMRNYVVTYYNTEVGRRRAVWLFNYIQQGRLSLLSFARKQKNKKAPFGLRDQANVIVGWIVFRAPLLWYCCPYKERGDKCYLCEEDSVADFQCTTPECHAAYCKNCLEQEDQKCVLCRIKQTLETDDISEEEPSEDDETYDDEMAVEENGVVEAETERDELSKTGSVYHTVIDMDSNNSSANSCCSFDQSADNDQETNNKSSTIYHSILNSELASPDTSENDSSTNIKLETVYTESSLSFQRHPARYFMRPRNENNWASIDDFDLPMPEPYAWIQHV